MFPYELFFGYWQLENLCLLTLFDDSIDGLSTQIFRTRHWLCLVVNLTTLNEQQLEFSVNRTTGINIKMPAFRLNSKHIAVSCNQLLLTEW